GHRAIQKPRVEVSKAEVLGDKFAKRTLARCCRSVDGNDHAVPIRLASVRTQPAAMRGHLHRPLECLMIVPCGPLPLVRCSSPEACAQSFHQLPKLGKARCDHRRIIHRDRLPAGKPHCEKSHSDAVVEMRRDSSAASRSPARALDDEGISIRDRLDTICNEPTRRCRQPVAFLDLKLSQTKHFRAAAREGIDHGEDRVLLNHARHSIRRSSYTRTTQRTQTDDSYALATIVTHVEDRAVATQLQQRQIESGSGGVYQDALDRHFGARNPKCWGCDKGRRARN